MDGEIKLFGSDPNCDIVIPDEEVDKKQFSICNLNGQLYFNCWSKNILSSVKMDLKKEYRLENGDIIGFGQVEAQVVDCTYEKLPDQPTDAIVNIRDLPENMQSRLNQKENLSETPTLTLQFTQSDLHDFSGETVTFDASKEYKIGRGSAEKFGNDLEIDADSVSRQHSKIRYDKNFGWLMREYHDT